MKIILNDGEDLVIQTRDENSKSLAIMCRGSWLGVREFKAPQADNNDSKKVCPKCGREGLVALKSRPAIVCSNDKCDYEGKPIQK